LWAGLVAAAALVATAEAAPIRYACYLTLAEVPSKTGLILPVCANGHEEAIKAQSLDWIAARDPVKDDVNPVVVAVNTP
jgi:hypothetical protein